MQNRLRFISTLHERSRGPNGVILTFFGWTRETEGYRSVLSLFSGPKPFRMSPFRDGWNRVKKLSLRGFSPKPHYLDRSEWARRFDLKSFTMSQLNFPPEMSNFEVSRWRVEKNVSPLVFFKKYITWCDQKRCEESSWGLFVPPSSTFLRKHQISKFWDTWNKLSLRRFSTKLHYLVRSNMAWWSN